MQNIVQFGQVFSTPTPELEDDDLSFLQSMIHQKKETEDPLDFSFLKNELLKRKPPPQEVPKGISILEDQVKKPVRQPKYIKSSVPPPTFPAEESNIDFSEVQSRRDSRLQTSTNPQLSRKHSRLEKRNIEISENPDSRLKPRSPQHTAPQNVNNEDDTSKDSILNNDQNNEEQSQNSKFKRKESKFISWKYVGFNGGVFGVYSGKVDLKGRPSSIQHALASLPYKMQNSRFEKPKVDETQEEPIEKVKHRNLFKLSIQKGTNEMARWEEQHFKRSKTSLNQEEPESRLYLESGDKLIPLAPSRLHGPPRL